MVQVMCQGSIYVRRCSYILGESRFGVDCIYARYSLANFTTIRHNHITRITQYQYPPLAIVPVRPAISTQKASTFCVGVTASHGRTTYNGRMIILKMYESALPLGNSAPGKLSSLGWKRQWFSAGLRRLGCSPFFGNIGPLETTFSIHISRFLVDSLCKSFPFAAPYNLCSKLPHGRKSSRLHKLLRRPGRNRHRCSSPLPPSHPLKPRTLQLTYCTIGPPKLLHPVFPSPALLHPR